MQLNLTNLLILMILVGLSFNVIIGLLFLSSSIYERENRAIILGAFQLTGMLAGLIIYIWIVWKGYFYDPVGNIMLYLLSAFFMVAAFIMLRKDKSNHRALAGSLGYAVSEIERFDERCLVFARNRALIPGSEYYNKYYELHPEHLEYDSRRRKKGGVNGEMGKIDYPNSGFETAMALSALSLCVSLSKPEMVRPKKMPPAEKFVRFSASFTTEEATRRVKGFALKLGADLVGITRIKPEWIYSKRGEIHNDDWHNWGKPIELEHPFAIVFAEEMDLDLIQTAPHTPTLVESMHNYAKGAYISTQMAAFIANLGYSATANHLRHYELILPPVAVDAGLGELSRMGYLLTKEFGPRIRLSAVTTDLPLKVNKPIDLGIQSFCKVCKKCAVCCPSNSIPNEDEPKEHNGTLRWKLDEESCFNYWGTVGTDCNICMRVCPWSHARTFPHRLIMYLTQRNRFNQKLFSWMDDIFYGRKPVTKKTHTI